MFFQAFDTVISLKQPWRIMKVLPILLITMSLFASPDWDSFTLRTLNKQASLPGWCPKEKAREMMKLIYEIKPEICVEVGVFGGSSLFPCASALKYIQKGHLYGIDPWKNEACLEGYENNDPNYKWWNSIDLEKIYRDLKVELKNHQLKPFCTLVRSTADKAISMFSDESIDILHIDGNHTEENAFNDARLFLPKVKKGGYIWFDDINWSSTGKAVTFLKEHCELDLSRTTHTYALFKKK
jgi:predicted O-methyltransferase YrrM